MKQDTARPARQRAIRRRQAVAATVLFGLTLLALFATLWPELPFPEVGGVLSVFAAGLLFGLMLDRWWGPLLGLAVLPTATVATGSLWAAVVAVFVAGPAAGLGLMSGALWSAKRIRSAREQRAPARRRRRRSRAALVEAPQGR
jgi:hypothetical protein